MGLLEKLLGKIGQRGHYVFKCRTCDFKHRIPNAFKDDEMALSVEHGKAKVTCLYGGRFTVSLGVGEFFSSYLEASSGKTLQAGIAENMKALHPHMLKHCDPLFLVIRQTPTSTEHEYTRKQPEVGVPYVRYMKGGGTDFVGHERVNIGKAEIPGVSWKVEELQPKPESDNAECGCLPFFAAFLLANPYGFSKRSAIYASQCSRCGTGYYTFLDKQHPTANDKLLPTARRGKFSDAALDAEIQNMIKRAAQAGIPASEIEILKSDATPAQAARARM
jgi:hypothetical protein